MSNKQVTCYMVGGTGVNLGRLLARQSLNDKLEVLAPEIYYIDTSESNLNKPGIDKGRVFLYEGLDGSGQERGENNPIIAKTTLKILQQFKPSAFNIVVSSASGGSGAVIAHHLIKELKKQNQQVILLLIGSTASRKQIENSVATLRSLDLLAHDLNSPIAVHYLENAAPFSREDIDRCAVGGITALLGLLAGTHDELDSADLRKWLNHEDLHPEAYSLQIAYTHKEYASAVDVVSVATLAAPGTATTLEPIPAYQAVGFVNEAWTKGEQPILAAGEPVSFMLSSEIVEKASAALLARLTEVKSVHASRVRRDTLVDDGKATEDGLYL